jgi:diguanylate cyclase (GGDEF)-like protein
MWVVTIRSPWHEPREQVLPPGVTSLGRKVDNGIIIADESASRRHAEFEHTLSGDRLIIRDLDSTNGTYVNRERLSGSLTLNAEDQIRIGQHTLTVSQRPTKAPPDGGRRPPATQPITRDLVLEAVDQHALVLYEVANRLNMILELEPALEEVSNLARTALGASQCAVIPARQFDRLAGMGFPASVAHQAIEQRSVVWISDMAAEPESGADQDPSADPIRSVVCVPGMMGSEVIALTYAYRSGRSARPFDQRDVQLAVAISHQAALTVQRANLLDKASRLEQLAMSDELTGLPNRRHLFELGEAEFDRARRYRRPLSALMIDIDAFKQVNDRYGHPVGDQVLRAVAQRCRSNLREQHLLGRYGGDEFVGLLLECGRLEAELVAERLRRRVAEAPIETNAGALAITISTGCAVLIDDCANVATLIALADAALLAAKRARAGPS